MESLEQLKARIESAIVGARLEIIPNDSPAQQPSLLVDPVHLVEVATWLRDTPGLRFDYASNVTGVDWLDRVEKTVSKVRRLIDGVEKEVEETSEVKKPGYLEVVYHLYSVELRHGPVILRARTRNRSQQVQLPSLTPVWRGCELQEREVFDLYGVQFTGHPDLRRLLMWEGFQDHPMRKDYVEPNDYEYEPTAHDEVVTKAAAAAPVRG